MSKLGPLWFEFAFLCGKNKKILYPRHAHITKTNFRNFLSLFQITVAGTALMMETIQTNRKMEV